GVADQGGLGVGVVGARRGVGVLRQRLLGAGRRGRGRVRGGCGGRGGEALRALGGERDEYHRGEQADERRVGRDRVRGQLLLVGAGQRGRDEEVRGGDQERPEGTGDRDAHRVVATPYGRRRGHDADHQGRAEHQGGAGQRVRLAEEEIGRAACREGVCEARVADA